MKAIEPKDKICLLALEASPNQIQFVSKHISHSFFLIGSFSGSLKSLMIE